MKSEEYLNEIRKSPGLSRAVLKKIEVGARERKARFFLVTDTPYSAEDIAYASEVSARYAPQGFTASADVKKVIPDAAGVRRAVSDMLKTRYPAVAAFVDPSDVEAVIDEGGGRFFIDADEAECARMTQEGILDAICAGLQRQFCGAWLGDVRLKKKERGEIERAAPPAAEYVQPLRAFPIEEYEAIDGAKCTQAIYIADLAKELQGVTVCGTISYIEERQTKNGKPYFTVTLSDGTGQLRASYFSKQATVEKVRALKAGDSICLTGDNELYNGGLSFRSRKIDRGRAPEGFVPKERASRPVPAQYRAVFPAPASDLIQGTLFGGAALPKEFCEREFVVFDLETTGLNTTPAMGAMDRIIELGAVKISGGKITEKFSTFVACPVRLSDEIVKLTGISDDMLVGAPVVGDVIADFYKFSAGCSLVAHNIQFDSKFIAYYGEQEGYYFNQKQYDTLALAQKLLHLSHYRLNDVADFFGFTFNHHRAFDDAFVTAKIFIELVRLAKTVD